MLADCLTKIQSTQNSIHLSKLGLEIKSSLEPVFKLGRIDRAEVGSKIPLLFFDNVVAASLFFVTVLGQS